MSHIGTMVRVRPLLEFEDECAWSAKHNNISCLDTKSVRDHLRLSKHSLRHTQQQIQQYSFNFDNILHPHTTSQQLYNLHCKPLIIQSIQNHLNCSILAYGQTCSGKTYTTLGTSDAAGIIPCAFRDMFKYDSNCEHSISIMEIYNENVYDLLHQHNKPLKLVDHKIWGCEVENITKQPVANYAQCIQLLEVAQNNRSYAQKQNHDRSSRSHTILKIYLSSINSNYQLSHSTITIVDLAGAERLTHSQHQLNETKHINKSLFHLSYVIDKLSHNQHSHIPYRDSKLTRLLESSLKSINQTIMIFCISPATINFYQTLETLRLANKTKKIQIQPNDHLVQQQLMIGQLKKQLTAKKKECKQLKHQIQQLTQQINKLKNNQQSNKVMVKVMVLMDHQNFTIHQQNNQCQYALSQQQEQQFNNHIIALKQTFLNQMRNNYEEYASQIVATYYQYHKHNHNINIQQLCFMNMIYQPQSIINYKLLLIEEMLSNYGNHNTNSFYHTLKQYHHNLITKLSANTMHQQSLTNHYLVDQSSIHSSSKFINNNNANTHQLGDIAYVWGCNKDWRVCKGSKVNDWMVKVKGLGKLSQAACGAHHSFVLNQEGDVYGWGKNQQQQLLPNESTSISIPTKIKINEKITSVCGGWSHSCALGESGVLYTWGSGSYGQLGHGNTLNVASPTKVQHFEYITKIYCGHSHTGFIDTKEDYYAFGFNQDYRLMLTTRKQVNIPTKVNLKGIIKAGLGVNHSCLISKDGRVYCGGVGTDGQFGVDLNQQYEGYQEFEVVDRKFNQQKLEKICPLVEVPIFCGENKGVEVACGQYMTCIINNKKQLYTFGRTSFNRLGHTNKYPTVIAENVEKVTVGCRHGFCWDRRGRVYGWGFNMYNQLGMVSEGDVKTAEIVQALSAKNMISISCGYFHSLGISNINENNESNDVN